MNYMLALPEIFLAAAGLALLMLGVFLRGEPTERIAWLSVLALIVTGVLLLWAPPPGTQTAFQGLYVVDQFARFLKFLVLLGSALTIIMSLDYIARENMRRFEFPVLLLFATLGMLMMLSANDLIALYVGLELQSLALYVVAAFQRDSERSTEAGLKYFVLGALSSGMLLYGASMVYGFAGTTSFAGLAKTFAGTEGPVAIGLIVGLVFVIAGLAFKVSAVPFHMWTPDVYEGAPTPVTAFFAAAPKLAAIGLFMRVMVGPFGELHGEWLQIIWFISVASMILGAVAAVAQTNIKRLMAYSSIGNMGYALVGLAPGTPEGIRGVLVYVAIYLFMTLGTFGCILLMRQKGKLVEGIYDLAGLSKTKPPMAAALAVFMFSLAGVPPLAGFFGKFYVFYAAVQVNLIWLAVIGFVTSVVSAFYYLRIVKVMYFDEPVASFDRSPGWSMNAIIAGSGLLVLLFLVFAGPVLDAAQAAAASLFPELMATLQLPAFYRLVAHEQIDSTNGEAKRLAAGGAESGTLVWAGEQLAGRGRRGRGWASPPGNLYASLLLRPACPPAQACQLNFVAAVALVEAVSSLLPAAAAVTLKWPNDVLVGGAKVSGILLEASAALDRSIDWLVIGVGVNVASHPADTLYPATSLRREGAASATAAAVLEGFAERFQAWYETWRGEGFAPVRARWLASARGLGEPIEVRLERETLQGRFGDLDESGALMLDMRDGARRQITTGDLFFPQL